MRFRMVMLVLTAYLGSCREPTSPPEAVAKKSAVEWADWLELPADDSEEWNGSRSIEWLHQKRVDSDYDVLLTRPQTVWSETQRQSAIRAAEERLADGFKVRKNPVIVLGAPINWGANPKNDRNWHFQVNALRAIEPVLNAYGATRDPRYHESVMAVVMDWINYNITEGRPNKMKWYDMAVGYRAIVLGAVLEIELGVEEPDEERIRLLVEAAWMHLDWLRNPDNISAGNHGVFMMMGLKALCIGIPELRGSHEAAEYANKQISELLDRQYSESFWHTEDAPSYHIFVTETFNTVVGRGFFTDLKRLRVVVNGARSHFHQTFHPNGDAVLIGDSAQGALTSASPYLSFLTSEGTKGAAPPSGAQLYPDVGYAIVRSSWEQKPFRDHSFLFLTASHHNPGHTHSDFLGFEWSERGIPILVDSGKYTYQKNLWREFFTSTRAGNTVEVSNTDDDLQDLKHNAELRGGKVGKDIYWVEAQFARPHNTQHTRLLVMREDRWLLVLDQLVAPEEQDFQQWFGFNESIEISKHTNFVLKATLPNAEGDLFVQEINQAATESVELVRGREGDRPQGWISRTYEEKQPRYVIGFGRKGVKETTFATLFSFDFPVTRSRVQTKAGALIVRFTDDRDEDTVLNYTAGSDPQVSRRSTQTQSKGIAQCANHQRVQRGCR